MEKKNKLSNTSYRPEGAHTITPYLILKDASKFIDFAKKAFDAQVVSNNKTDDGKIMNAMLTIGDSGFMIGDQMKGMDVENTMLYLYVKDVDAVYKQALAAGAEKLREVRDEFYGDRAGAVKDKWGNKWWLATHQEDVSDEELSKRMKKSLTADEKNQSLKLSTHNLRNT